MSKGPILSCGWCDEWQQCGVRPSADDCRTPESCPLRAQAIAELASKPEPRAWRAQKCRGGER